MKYGEVISLHLYEKKVVIKALAEDVIFPGEIRLLNLDDVILEQFSYMLDKNKKEIYEGDIVSLINAYNEKLTAVCEFGIARREMGDVTVDIPSFYFKLSDGWKSYPIVNNYLKKHDLEIMEVVGNIHEGLKLPER